MKKTLKVLAIIALLLLMLIVLTGCGNKLVATREVNEDGISCKEKSEFKFKDDKLDSVKTTMTFEDKDKAEEYGEILEDSLKQMEAIGRKLEGIEVSTKGKKVIMEINADMFLQMAGMEESEATKDKIKESLEGNEYKVK